MSTAVAVLRKELTKKEAELRSLTAALKALGSSTGSSTGKGNRKPRTAAQKENISAALKKSWAARKRAAKKAAAAE